MNTCNTYKMLRLRLGRSLITMMIGCVGVGLLAWPAQSQLTDPPYLPPDSYEKTLYGVFDNCLKAGGGPCQPVYGGNPAVAVSAGGGGTFTDAGGTINLTNVAFGQLFGTSVPYKTDQGLAFRDDFIARAQKMLYYDRADNTPGFQKDDAAFLYKVRLYVQQPDSNGTQNFNAHLENMATYWDPAGNGPREQRAYKAIPFLKHVLKYEPTYAVAQDALLDIYYNIATAYTVMAREQQLEAVKYAIAVPASQYWPAPGEFTIENERQALTDALPYFDQGIGAYLALLFDDNFGGPATRLNAAYPEDMPFGEALFRDAQPHRALLAPTGFDAAGNLAPVLDEDGQTGPDVLFEAYKDVVLLFDTERDALHVVAQAAKLYGLMGETQAGRDFLQAQWQTRYTEGNLLTTFLPAGGWDDPSLAESGVAASKTGWVQGVTELSGVKAFLQSEANPLGVTNDFLALVQTDVPGTSQTNIRQHSFDYFQDLLTDEDFVLKIAVAKHEEAHERYHAYNEKLQVFRDQIAVELRNMRMTIADRLWAINGAEYGDSPDPAYAHPEENVGGEIYNQLLNVEKARVHIQRNSQELRNLNANIQIQFDLRTQQLGIYAEMKDLYLDSKWGQFSLTMGIGAINGAQKAADNVAQAAASAGDLNLTFGISGTAAYTANAVFQAAAEVAKAGLQGVKELMEYDMQAALVDQEGQLTDVQILAEIKSMYLEMRLLQIDTLEVELELLEEQSKLVGLYDEMHRLEAKWEGADELLSARYFADPANRVILDKTLLEANFSFQRAQMWVYILARALEYKHNLHPLYAPSLTDSLKTYTANTVFRLRNAAELQDMAQALYAKDQELTIGLLQGLGYVRFSLREDVLGYYSYDVDGNPALYPDPLQPFTSGATLTPQAAFRRKLQQYKISDSPHLLDYGQVVRIPFSTVQTNLDGTFFSQNRGNEKIKRILIQVRTSPLAGITSTMIYLEQSGTGYLRTRPYPVTQERDLQAYPVRLWTQDPVTALWRGVDVVGVTMPALISQAALWDLLTTSAAAPLTKAANAAITTLQKEGAPVTATSSKSYIEQFERAEFHERPAAVNQWYIEIPLKRSTGYPLFNLDTLEDIELWFSNYSNG